MGKTRGKNRFTQIPRGNDREAVPFWKSGGYLRERPFFAKVYSPAFIPWFCTFWVEHALVFHFIYHFVHSRLLDVVVCDPAADGAPHRCSFGLIPVEWVKKCFTFFVSEVYLYSYSPKDYGF